MFAHISFEEVEKQGLFKRILNYFKKKDYINEISLDFLNSFYIEVKINYTKDQSYNEILKKINEAQNQMKAYNIRGILLNKSCKFYNEIESLGFNIYDPTDFYNKNILKIIKCLSNKDNRVIKENVCVINDTHFYNLNFDFLSELINICHTVGIITKDENGAVELTDELYEQKGIPIIFLQDFNMLKKANFVILFDDAESFLNNNINKNAYIITADPLFKIKKFYENTIITDFLFKLEKNMKLNIPKGLSQMEFFGAISEYYDTNLILNLEISNIITNKASIVI